MDAVRLTGLWKEKDKNGSTYLSGKLNGIASVLVMPNTFKREPRDPEYYLYIRYIRPNKKKPNGEKAESRGNNP